jgi:MoCo/4Fe-4S cofactor protein with predicted Tat translocation signal
MSFIQINGNSLTGRKYWRSLDQLADKPEFQEWVHREFPENASEMLDGSSRRNILKLMAASFGLAGLTACRRPVEHILPNAKGVEDYIPGKPYFYATAMPLGGTVQGLLVETHDGRPTKIEGNPDHPYSLGAASAFHQASILNLYDPDRLKSVTADGKPSTWEEYKKFAPDWFAKQGAGEKVRYLSETITSPTLAAQKQAVLEKMPKAKWIEYEPLNNDNVAAGMQIAFGQPLAVHPRYDQADVIVALDCDFLGLDSPTVLPVKQFSKGRRPDIGEPTAEQPKREELGPMNRLYAVESNYSITGAMADHRLRMRLSEVKAFAVDLAGALGITLSLNVVNSTDKRSKLLAAIVKDLKAHPGKALVIAGPRQPAEVHALVAAMNQALAAPVAYTKLDFDQPQIAALTELANDMAKGAVETIVILGGNPAYTAPANLDFAANLRKVPVSIYLAFDENETAAVSKWLIPEAHYLESWSDGTAPDGTTAIIQPMIEPLYGGKTAAEIVSLAKAYDLVRATWLSPLKDKGWREALHNGIVPNTRQPEIKTIADVKKIGAASAVSKAAEQGIEVAWYASSTMYDGRFNNNGWMQEAPDTMTKLVWGNAALVSPKTAKEFGLEDGDVVKLTRGAVSGEFAVMKQPGHADHAISLNLGYGRTSTGRVGKGVGFNAYALRATESYSFADGFTLAKTGKSVTLATTQHHHSLEGRPLLREASLAEYKKNPKVVEEQLELPKLESIYGDWDYSKGYQWGMAIDLASCVGCNACMLACQSENNIPVVGVEQVLRGREMHWIRMDRYYNGDEDDPQVVYQGVPCMQCENAPCANVCPVAATVHSPEGLNDMAYNRCIGTRYCANNCPYKVRRFNFLNFHKHTEEVEKMVSNPDVSVRMRGVMEKCTYCVQRIQETKIKAKTEGRRAIPDGEIQTACQQTCPADAIVFGNINDPDSRVSKLKKQDRNYAMLAELNVKPRTTYLAKLRNPNPEVA